MRPENKQIAKDLITHLRLGKQILGKPRKPIGLKTEIKYKQWLNKVDGWFDKPFNLLTEQDIDDFRLRLKDDKITREDGKPFKPSVKRDIEQKFLKTLLKFLDKEKLSLFSCEYKEHTEIEALNRDEINKVVAQLPIRDKVIWQVLFDSGARIDEFMHIRFKDIDIESLEKNGYYKVWIRKSKTIPRCIGLTLKESTDILKAWLDLNKDKLGTEEPLVKLSYQHISSRLKDVGKRILGKRVYPHLLRHSSASLYCSMLSHYQLCKRYGWSMNSDMPAVYIDRQGIEEDTINKKVVKEENVSLLTELNSLKEKLSLKTEEEKGNQELLDKFIEATNKQISLLADKVKDLAEIQIQAKHRNEYVLNLCSNGNR